MQAVHASTLVVGAGSSGLAASLQLAATHAGAGLLVVDAASGPLEGLGDVLDPRSSDLLSGSGVTWGELERLHRPCGVHVMDWGGQGTLRRQVLANSTLVLERRLLEISLLRHLEQRGLRVEWGWRVCTVNRTNSQWHVDLMGNDGQRRQVIANYLVDASGHTAAMASRLGANRVLAAKLCAASVEVHECDEISDVLPLRAPTSHRIGAAIVEAVADGWWRALPLPGRRVQVTFFYDPDLTRLQTMVHWQNRYEATSVIAASLGNGTVCGTMQVRDCRIARSEPCAGEGWWALGAAAASADPVLGGILRSELEQVAAFAQAARENGNVPSHEQARRRTREVEERFARDLTRASQIYRAESRFADAPFWRRRQGNATLRRTLSPVDLIDLQSA